MHSTPLGVLERELVLGACLAQLYSSSLCDNSFRAFSTVGHGVQGHEVASRAPDIHDQTQGIRIHDTLQVCRG